tara:strand:- start:2743 stop:3312 length:570 start_codon:yes stop_codon:yes gene_type:complete
MNSDIKYDLNTNIASDTCWKNAKETNNKEINDYTLYDKYAEYKSDNNYGSMPDFRLNHPNLRGRVGYGLSDDYLIDNYSALRNDPNSLTHDKCASQLFARVFQAPPLLKGAEGNVEKELDLLSGNDTNVYKSKKTVMEKEKRIGYPLVDSLQDIQNPDNIVPQWTNGGEDTRSYKNRSEFNKRFTQQRR